jgi:CheY-like chemotaxis protein
MGDFGALHRLGFDTILSGKGLDVIEVSGNDLVERLVQSLPDVVVLDLDQEDAAAIIGRIVRDFPSVQVVACSSSRPMMKVFPKFHGGESYTTGLAEPSQFSRVLQL